MPKKIDHTFQSTDANDIHLVCPTPPSPPKFDPPRVLLEPSEQTLEVFRKELAQSHPNIPLLPVIGINQTTPSLAERKKRLQDIAKGLPAAWNIIVIGAWDFGYGVRIKIQSHPDLQLKEDVTGNILYYEKFIVIRDYDPELNDIPGLRERLAMCWHELNGPQKPLPACLDDVGVMTEPVALAALPKGKQAPPMIPADALAGQAAPNPKPKKQRKNADWTFETNAYRTAWMEEEYKERGGLDRFIQEVLIDTMKKKYTPKMLGKLKAALYKVCVEK